MNALYQRDPNSAGIRYRATLQSFVAELRFRASFSELRFRALFRSFVSELGELGPSIRAWGNPPSRNALHALLRHTVKTLLGKPSWGKIKFSTSSTFLSQRLQDDTKMMR